MISPSDAIAADLGQAATGKKAWQQGRRSGSVTPLEFQAIDHPLRRKTDSMEYQEEMDQRNLRMREEMERLESRIRAQAEQISTQLVEARQEGRVEARTEWEQELEQHLQAERERIAQLGSDFAKARVDYFAAVEKEILRLSLAIASRVLHREARLDPLLLSAVVRMALEKLEEESSVTLHVPVASVEAWSALMSGETKPPVHVVGEEGMQAGECVLETTVGRVEMGIVAQMEEIERGFFDLLQQRPA